MPESMMVNPRSKKLWRFFHEPSAIPKNQSPIRGARRVLYRAQKRIPSGDSALTLENLPSLVLNGIFEYVQSPYLARISGLSRDFYWPIVSRIYRSIAFVCDSEISEVTDWLNGSVINYYTVIPKRKMETFVESLQNNPSLRDLVQSVNLSCDVPAELADTLFGMLTIVKAYCTERYDGMDKIRSELETLIVHILRAPPLSSHLAELRIVGSTSVFDMKSYQTLARDLCQLRGHLSLRKLHLAAYSLLDMDQDRPVIGHPHWFMFLEELIAQKVTLHLTTLGLYGKIEAFAQATIHRLRRCVYLEEVYTLALSIGPDQAPGVTFMEKIIKKTPKLDNLAIHSMWNRSTRPPNALCNVLKNIIPHKLKALLILYLPYGGGPMIADNFRDNIQKAVLNSQRNLVKLKIEGRHRLFHQTGWPGRGPQYFQDSYFQDLRRGLSRQKDFLCIFGNPHVYPRLSKTSVKLVKRHITKIRNVMTTDLICANAATDLPFLTHYCIDMVAFDLKQGGVIVNDEVILLDPLNKAHLLWHLHGISLKWDKFVSYVKKRR